MDDERTQAVNVLGQLKEVMGAGWAVHIMEANDCAGHIMYLGRSDDSYAFIADTLDEVIGMAVQWARKNESWE